MEILYHILVVIHVLSAILGLGPGFILIQVVKSAHNMTELKHAYQVRRRLHTFVMIGGTSLIITGLIMGMIHPYLFRMGWYVTSIILFMVALLMGPLVMSPKSKTLKHVIDTHNGENIPPTYKQVEKKLFIYERISSLLFLIIIVLMVLKPF